MPETYCGISIALAASGSKMLVKNIQTYKHTENDYKDVRYQEIKTNKGINDVNRGRVGSI